MDLSQSELEVDSTSRPTATAAPRVGAAAKSRFTRELVSITAGRAVTKICQFLIGVIAARLIGPEGRGLIAALAVAPAVAVTFSQFGMREAVAFYIGKKTYEAQEVVPTLLGMAFSANVVAIGGCLAYYYATGLIDQPWLLVVLALAPIPFMLLTMYAAGVFLGKMMIARFNRVNWMPMALNLLLVILLGWALGLGVVGVMLAAAVAPLLSCIYAYHLLRDQVRLRIGFNREIATKLTRLGMVYAATLVTMLLNSQLPILLLHNLSSLEQVGIYAVGQTIALMIWEVPGTMANLVFSRSVNASDKAAFSQKVTVLARMVLLAGIGIAVGCALLGPTVIPLVYGAKFMESATVLTVLLPGTVAFMLFRVLLVDLQGRGHPWASIPVVLPCMIANAGFAMVVIPEYGAVGAAALTSASYVVATVAYVLVYARMTRQSLRSILIYRASDFAAVRQRVRQLRR